MKYQISQNTNFDAKATDLSSKLRRENELMREKLRNLNKSNENVSTCRERAIASEVRFYLRIIQENCTE